MDERMVADTSWGRPMWRWQAFAHLRRAGGIVAS